MHGKKPSVFISSTIYDFRDLRSAIKYYLEELGYEVLLSEYNDFPKPLDQNAYEACVATLQRADYYILLIGSRVGGYYDARSKVSITRMEYRRAYELASSDRIRLIVFVRDDLWKVKGDRRALVSFLATESDTLKDITPEDRRRIANHPSQFVNDADSVFSFIDEVLRADQLKAATEGQAPFPLANWVHTFTTFRDVVDVLRTHLGISETLSTVAMKVNLQREMIEDIAALCTKHQGKVSPAYTWASFARKRITGSIDDRSQMPGKYLRWVVMYSIVGNIRSRLSTTFLDQALASGQFFQYDKEAATYRPTLLSERLFQLKDRIEKLSTMAEKLGDGLIDFSQQYSNLSKTESEVSVPNSALLLPLAFADTQQDVLVLCVAILNALEGDAASLSSVSLNPPSPFAPEAEIIAGETVSPQDVKAWISSILKATP